MSQSELAASMFDKHQERENRCAQVTIGFGFTSDWVKKSGASFPEQLRCAVSKTKANANNIQHSIENCSNVVRKLERF